MRSEVKEVSRNADSSLEGLYQFTLDDAGIVSFVQNGGTQRSLVDGLTVAFFQSHCCVGSDSLCENYRVDASPSAGLP